MLTRSVVGFRTAVDDNASPVPPISAILLVAMIAPTTTPSRRMGALRRVVDLDDIASSNSLR